MHAYFDKTEKCLVITGNKSDPVWHCQSYYKLFKDGVHQEEVWFREGDMADSPEWMLDGADCFELDCANEENGWKFGFYYGVHMRPSHQHSLIAWAKGVGQNREIIIRSISVKEKN